MNFLNKVSLFLIRFYQITLSYFLGGNCRFEPSCSHYAIECFKYFPFFKASKLTVFRLLKCQPFCKQHGYDPIPIHKEYYE